MKFFVVAVLTLLGTRGFADKVLHVSGNRAAELYAAFTGAGAKPVNGAFDIGATNCEASTSAERGDPNAKWEYVTEFNCSIDGTPSYNNSDPINGSKAQAIITALNRAGIHSYRSPASGRNYTKSVFVQSVSCEKAGREEDESDLMPPTPALFGCFIRI